MFPTEQRQKQYNLGEVTIKLSYFPNCFSQGKGGKRRKEKRGGNDLTISRSIRTIFNLFLFNYILLWNKFLILFWWAAQSNIHKVLVLLEENLLTRRGKFYALLDIYCWKYNDLVGVYVGNLISRANFSRVQPHSACLLVIPLSPEGTYVVTSPITCRLSGISSAWRFGKLKDPLKTQFRFVFTSVTM